MDQIDPLQIAVFVGSLSLIAGAIAKIVSATDGLRRGRKDFFATLNARNIDIDRFLDVKSIDIGAQITISAADPNAKGLIGSADVLYLLDNEATATLTAELVLGTKGITIATSFPDPTSGDTGWATILFLAPFYLRLTQGWHGKLLMHANHTDIEDIRAIEGTNSIIISQKGRGMQVVSFPNESQRDAWLKTWETSQLVESDTLHGRDSVWLAYPLTIIPQDNLIVDAAGKEICRKAGHDLEFDMGPTRSKVRVKNRGGKEFIIIDQAGNTVATFVRDGRLTFDSITLSDGMGEVKIKLAAPDGQIRVIVEEVEHFRMLRIQNIKQQYMLFPAGSRSPSEERELYLLFGIFLLLRLISNIASFT